MSAVASFFGLGPDTPEVTAAKAKVAAAEEELAKAKEAAKNAPAPETTGTAPAAALGQANGGRRRKHKGGKHTKKHRKSGKGKSRKLRK
jgi:hypothetical protein